jgi:hypothetical protein
LRPQGGQPGVRPLCHRSGRAARTWRRGR